MSQYPRRGIVFVSVFATLIIITACVTAVRRASGQESLPSQPRADHRAERLEEMKQIAGSFKVVAIDEHGQQTPASLSAEPLHRWTDPTREFDGGALWVWRASGRPVAVIGIELYARWSLEFVSVSTGLVKADDGHVCWTPRKGGVEFREIPEAPAPAADAAERLRQMRDLAKRFSAREHWVNRDGNGQHYALRLLPHPIDRYADPGSGVVDGALFVYAYGTNPESLLLIEARRRGADPGPLFVRGRAAFPRRSFAQTRFQRRLDVSEQGHGTARGPWRLILRRHGRPAALSAPKTTSKQPN